MLEHPTMTGQSAEFVDRRRAVRHRLALPVELEHGGGVTRDVSASGVFFETDQSFLPGSPISFSLLFEHADPHGPVRLRCQGRVVRLEPHDGKSGVAVAFTSRSF